MNIEVGSIIEGRVTDITRFGAFVEVAPQKKGLVHISEVSNDFVKDVSDYLKRGQTVKVKVLSLGDNGRIELSIKQAGENFTGNTVNRKFDFKDNRNFKSDNNRFSSGSLARSEIINKAANSDNFEAMMAKFKKLSDDKLLDIKKHSESKRGRSPHKNVQ